MSLPSGDMYVSALQNPAVAFSDPDLRTAQVEKTQKMGLPRPFSGGFTMTFHMHGHQEWAVRCFTREVPEVKQRYEAITKFLLSVSDPMFARAELKPNGILVGSLRYDIIKMDWHEGVQLHVFVRDNLNNRSALLNLGERIFGMGMRLNALGMAHGDLQHGNILVNPAGELRLVDYDDIFLPELAGIGHSSGLGQMNYQHPGRRNTHYGPDIDRFSIYAIYVALLALADSPRLWDRFDGGDEKILFGRDDLAAPSQSALFAELSELPTVSPWIDKFASICTNSYAEIPGLTDFLDGRFPFGRYLPAAQAKTRAARPTFSASTPVSPPGQRAGATWQFAASQGSSSQAASTASHPQSISQHNPYTAAVSPPAKRNRFGSIATVVTVAIIGWNLLRGFHGSPQTYQAPPVAAVQEVAPIVPAQRPSPSDIPTNIAKPAYRAPSVTPTAARSMSPKRVADAAPPKISMPLKLSAVSPTVAPSSVNSPSVALSATAVAPPHRSLTDIAESSGDKAIAEQKSATVNTGSEKHQSLTEIAQEPAGTGDPQEQMLAGSVVSADAVHITINATAGQRTFALTRLPDVVSGVSVRIIFSGSQVRDIQRNVNGAWRSVY